MVFAEIVYVILPPFTVSLCKFTGLQCVNIIYRLYNILKIKNIQCLYKNKRFPFINNSVFIFPSHLPFTQLYQVNIKARLIV